MALPLIGRGKVRDIYSVDDDHLLIVTTDRLSAYDVVLPDPMPMKGAVLTRLHWQNRHPLFPERRQFWQSSLLPVFRQKHRI